MLSHQSPLNCNVIQWSLLGLVPHPLLRCSWGYFLWCPPDPHDGQIHGKLLHSDICDSCSEPTRIQHWTELCKHTGAKEDIVQKQVTHLYTPALQGSLAAAPHTYCSTGCSPSQQRCRFLFLSKYLIFALLTVVTSEYQRQKKRPLKSILKYLLKYNSSRSCYK